MSLQKRFANAAEALIGIPYKFHGQSREHGVDCVGLVALALSDSGGAPFALSNYRLRQGEISALLSYAEKSGFQRANEAVMRGDLIMVQPGPAQHHLMIALSHRTFAHAHASLRRVVEQSGHSDWPIIQHWRLQNPDGSEEWQP